MDDLELNICEDSFPRQKKQKQQKKKDTNYKNQDHLVEDGIPSSTSIGIRSSTVGPLSANNRRHIISSLFTYNPTSAVPTCIEEAAQLKTNFEPSNGISDRSFKSLGLNPEICQHLASKLLIEKPTGIQLEAIPRLLSCLCSRSTTSSTNTPIPKSDIILSAQTGSGKTLAYLLPLLQLLNTSTDLSLQKRSSGTHLLILCPTRELTTQVQHTIDLLLQSNLSYQKRWIVSGVLTGGEKKKSEKARLRKGVTVLVATPGRLLDHLQSTESFQLTCLKWLVLDEADRFLEFGLGDSVKRIVKELEGRCKCEVQLMLCSATVSSQVKELGGRELRQPVYISAKDSAISADFVEGTGGTKLSANSSIKDLKIDSTGSYNDLHLPSVPNQLKQHYMVCPAKLRLVTLIASIQSLFQFKNKINESRDFRKGIVFFSCKDSVEFHFSLFSNEQEQEGDSIKTLNGKGSIEDSIKDPKYSKYSKDSKTSKTLSSLFNLGLPINVYKLHGDIPHSERQSTFAQFTHLKQNALLLCTDVAARGLDLPGVTDIFQYDPPCDVNDYIHRAGRTARIGKTGSAVVWLLPHEVGYLHHLQAKGLTLFEMPLASLFDTKYKHTTTANSTSPSTNTSLYGLSPRLQETATQIQHQCEEQIQQNRALIKLAKSAYLSSIRAYTTHAALEKPVFNVRKLHLGHLAKAFGLRDAPSGIQGKDKQERKKRKMEKEKVVEKKRLKTPSSMSEFAAC